MIRVPDELEKKPVEVWSEPLNPPEEMGPPQPLEETNLNPSPPSIQGKTSLPSQKKKNSNLRRNTPPPPPPPPMPLLYSITSSNTSVQFFLFFSPLNAHFQFFHLIPYDSLVEHIPPVVVALGLAMLLSPRRPLESTQ